ncbi:hypothetical protein U1Q18_021447 [Sarracenia purpurea var. burkii]
MASLSNGGLCDGSSNKRPLENGYCTSSSVLLKYKKRKVSAVRDFPPGCGRYAPRINLVPQDTEAVASPGDKENSVADEKRVNVEKEDCVKSLEAGDEQLSHQVKDPVKLELPDSLDDLVGRVVAAAGIKVALPPILGPLEIDLPKALEIEAPKPSKELCDVKALDAIKSEGALETKTVLEISSTADGLVPVGGAKAWSPPLWPMSDANSSKDPAVKNKYPSRRVSAIRDFPPFCGRNAPCPTEEERLRFVLGNKTSRAPDNARVQVGLLRKTVRATEQESPAREAARTGFEELEGNVRNRNLPKRELKRSVPEPKTKSPKVAAQVKRVALGHNVDRVIVQGLMAAPNCPWRQGKGAANTKLVSMMMKSDMRGHDVTGPEKSKSVNREKVYEVDYSTRKAVKKKLLPYGKAPYKGKAPLVAKDEGDFAIKEQDEDSFASQGKRSNDFEVTLPPFGPNSSSHGDARNKVRETLRLFQAIFRKLLQGEEAKLKRKGEPSRRIDTQAAQIVRDKGKEVNTGKFIIGSVPGVEVGDEFQYRVELALVGIHRLYQGGIDYIKNGGMVIATSIVASGAYADDLDNADVLIYSGQGGNVVGKDKQPEDQKLERGNLALKNSISTRTPVRVTRGFKETKATNSDARAKLVPIYTYDGLYTVEKYWHEVGQHGKLVFKFELRRMPGQPELAWKEVKKSNKFKIREGLCVDDISRGKELFPICAVNIIDNEIPPTFTYITKMKYPDWYCPTPPKGCDCIGGCLDSKKCSCVVKNGGEIPYNYNGAIVEAKSLVYECGPSCKCPPSCYNRVSQHGIKIQLEIFKTESRGWGVRSLTSIPSGSFICEYFGELIDDKEAEQRYNDEYLFDIGKNYSDCSLMDGSSALKPDAHNSSSEFVEDGGFTIDAAKFGNVGRFINHSCSPNLYAQNVIYDHEDKKMPHIMLFAAENIPPLQELTYHYNYSVDQVHDSSGNIKTKNCYCGSAECSGRMY